MRTRITWVVVSGTRAEVCDVGAVAAVNCTCASVLRKILRLVKHTLASVSGVRDQEMALLDEMLAACAREASNKSLELIFSSHLFYQNRQERFISSLAGGSLHPHPSPLNTWPLLSQLFR